MSAYLANLEIPIYLGVANPRKRPTPAPKTLKLIMPVIQVETIIHSEISICFDLARSIDLHRVSMPEAKHFGIRQRLTSRITAFGRPLHFRDQQVRGAKNVRRD